MTIERTTETTESDSVKTETPQTPAPTDTSVEHSTTETTEVKTGDSDDGA